MGGWVDGFKKPSYLCGVLNECSLIIGKNISTKLKAIDVEALLKNTAVHVKGRRDLIKKVSQNFAVDFIII